MNLIIGYRLIPLYRSWFHFVLFAGNFLFDCPRSPFFYLLTCDFLISSSIYDCSNLLSASLCIDFSIWPSTIFATIGIIYFCQRTRITIQYKLKILFPRIYIYIYTVYPQKSIFPLENERFQYNGNIEVEIWKTSTRERKTREKEKEIDIINNREEGITRSCHSSFWGQSEWSHFIQLERPGNSKEQQAGRQAGRLIRLYTQGSLGRELIG